MKKTLALILALCMLMSLAACGSDKPASTPDEPAIDEPATMPEDNQPATMPEVEEPATDTDLPDEELPATETDLPDTELPATDTDLPVASDSKPLNILSAVCATYADDEKFAAMGGDAMNPVMDAPGACSTEDTEYLDAIFGLPVNSAAGVTAAASIMHMMNANTFTGACYELHSDVDTAAFVEEVKANILARQWMCGFPETLIIVEADGCIVTAFGNGEIIELFKQKLAGCFETTVLVEEPIG